MPIDTSMYANFRVPPPNPLEMVGQYAGVQNALAQNKLLQQELPLLQLRQQAEQQQIQGNQIELNAKHQLMGAVQNNINPNGTLNTVGLNNELGKGGYIHLLDTIEQTNRLNAPTPYAATPQGQLSAGAQAVGTAFAPGGGGAATLMGGAPQHQSPNQDQIDNAHEHLTNMQQTLHDLINLPDDELTTTKLIQTGADLGAEYAQSKGKRGISYREFAGEMSGPDFPREGPNGEPVSPDAIRQYLLKHYQNSIGAQASLTQKYGPSSAQQQEEQPQQPEQNAGQPQPPQGSTFTSLPSGYGALQEPNANHLNQVRAARDTVPQQLAVLNTIGQLSKGGAPTGTKIGQIYSELAKDFPGVVPQGITDSAAQLQEISKYMEQAALAAGVPASDARLAAVEQSNTHPEQLPQAIQALLPFLESSAEGMRARANFYDEQVGNGLDYTKIAGAQHTWANNYDPRGVLLDTLPGRDEKIEYLRNLSPQERAHVVKASKFVKPYLYGK